MSRYSNEKETAKGGIASSHRDEGERLWRWMNEVRFYSLICSLPIQLCVEVWVTIHEYATKYLKERRWYLWSAIEKRAASLHWRRRRVISAWYLLTLPPSGQERGAFVCSCTCSAFDALSRGLDSLRLQGAPARLYIPCNCSLLLSSSSPTSYHLQSLILPVHLEPLCLAEIFLF